MYVPSFDHVPSDSVGLSSECCNPPCRMPLAVPTITVAKNRQGSGTIEMQIGFMSIWGHTISPVHDYDGRLTCDFRSTERSATSRLDDKDAALAERQVTQSEGGTTGKATKRVPDAAASSDVGAALRNAFQAAVEEDVPNELLDLLRRLD